MNDLDTRLIGQMTAALNADGTFPPGSFTVVVSHRRRRAAITTALHGHRIVRVTPTTTPAHLIAFVRAHADVLARHAEQSLVRSPVLPSRRLEHGEVFYWLGRPYPLLVNDDQVPSRPSVSQAISVGRAELDQRGLEAITSWYALSGLDWMRRQSPTLWRRLRSRRSMPALAVRDLGRRRDGMFSESRNEITLHWRVFQLPEASVEYVLLHELTHATRPQGPSHGPVFAARLQRALPDADLRYRAYREQIRTAWRGDVEQI